jgi:RNA-binding protein
LLVLSPAERSALRARAHKLHPVVLLGEKGLTDASLLEIDHNLRAHELIKIRVAGVGWDQRDAILDEICDKLEAAQVQHIGKTLVIYRPRPAEEETRSRPRRRVRRAPRQPKRAHQNR